MKIAEVDVLAKFIKDEAESSIDVDDDVDDDDDDDDGQDKIIGIIDMCVTINEIFSRV